MSVALLWPDSTFTTWADCDRRHPLRRGSVELRRAATTELPLPPGSAPSAPLRPRLDREPQRRRRMARGQRVIAVPPPAFAPVKRTRMSFRRGVLAILVGLVPWSGLEAAPIEVRFAEGTAHGLLLVRSVSGETVGHEFRIGVNRGEVIIEGDRIYGDGVNIAARVQGLAEGGGVCISGSVCDEISGKLSLDCESLGEHILKNIDDPVRVYRMRMDSSPRGTNASRLYGARFFGAVRAGGA
jgi:Adenylate and Guanylate cyclase catalytic domain